MSSGPAIFLFISMQWEEHQKHRKRQLACGFTVTLTVSDQKLESGKAWEQG